jgi:hypothetical protein
MRYSFGPAAHARHRSERCPASKSSSNVRRRDHTLGHDPAPKPIGGLVALQSRKVIQYLPYASSQYGAGSSRY